MCDLCPGRGFCAGPGRSAIANAVWSDRGPSSRSFPDKGVWCYFFFSVSFPAGSSQHPRRAARGPKANPAPRPGSTIRLIRAHAAGPLVLRESADFADQRRALVEAYGHPTSASWRAAADAGGEIAKRSRPQGGAQAGHDVFFCHEQNSHACAGLTQPRWPAALAPNGQVGSKDRPAGPGSRNSPGTGAWWRGAEV